MHITHESPHASGAQRAGARAPQSVSPTPRGWGHSFTRGSRLWQGPHVLFGCRGKCLLRKEPLDSDWTVIAKRSGSAQQGRTPCTPHAVYSVQR